MEMFEFLPKKTRAITYLGHIVGLGFILAPSLSTLVGETITFEIDSYKEVTDLSDFSFFDELYVYPLVESKASNANDSLLILRDFSTGSQIYGIDDDTYYYEVINFAKYTSQEASPTIQSEIGYIGFKRENDTETTIPSDAVGFIRRSKRISDYSTNPINGLFTGLSGTMDWSPDDLDGTLEVNLSYNINGIQEERSFESYYTSSQGYVSFGALSFEMDPSDPDTDDWYFSSTTPDYLGQGEFSDTFQLLGYYDDEDLTGIIPSNVDTYDFWNRWYVIRLESPEDSDGDQIPDIMDYSTSVTTYPWYADLDYGEGLYWSYFLNTWITSNILTLWDYWTGFGWVYVPNSGSRDNFWFYTPGLEWLYTNEDIFPYIYSPDTGNYFYLVIRDEGSASYYDFSTQSWNSL